MGQAWHNNPSQTLSEQPAAARGAWFWIKESCLFPLRILSLILVLGLILSAFSMWIIPDMAAKRQVDMVQLVLRILDEEGPGRPFHRLGYQEKIHARLLELRPGQARPAPDDPPLPPPTTSLKDAVVTVTMTRTPAGTAYVVRYASGKTQQLLPTTAHTTVPPEELAAARQAVSRLFPTRDRKSWAQVLAWGESLFITSWVQKYDFQVVPRDRFPGPPGGQETEQLWCVWQVLRSGGAPEEELFRLPELFREAFPTKEEQEEALAWANTLYERLGSYYSARKHYYSISHNTTVGTYASFQRVLPPDTEWSRLWLLQQNVGLSPASRAAARQRWLGYFPANREEQVLTLGASLVEDRRGKSEPLPNVPDVLPALCVVERLTGTDGDGQSCADAMTKFFELKLLSLTLQFAYPNDDLYYLLASGDRLELFPVRSGERGSPVYYLAIVIFLLVIAGFATLGVQTTIQWFGTRLLLRKSTRPLWEKHLRGRGEEPWYLGVLGILLVAGLGCLTAPFSISEMIAVQIGSTGQLFLGALIATTCGGVLIATFRRLAALFLVAFGVDIEETWADEILGIVLGGLVLFHFGNDLLAIALFVLSDFLPALFFVGLRRLWGHGRHAAPAAKTSPPRVAPATAGVPAGSAGTQGWSLELRK